MSAPRRLSLYSQYLTGLAGLAGQPGQPNEPRTRLHLKAISGGKVRLQLDSPHSTDGPSPRILLSSEQRRELAQFLLDTPEPWAITEE